MSYDLGSIFEKAEQVIDVKGWWAGPQRAPRGDPFNSNVCLTMALGQVTRPHLPGEEESMAMMEAGVFLLRKLGLQETSWISRSGFRDLQEVVNWFGLTQWNDTHSEQEVRRLLLEAAADFERANQPAEPESEPPARFEEGALA